jgi:mannose-6-phosphate isomerase-like protein (cupin superfamily)
MQPTKNHREGVQANWARRGFTCELWIDPPNQVWHDFEHDVDELVFLLEGTCQIELPDRTVRMHAGDELVIPAGTRHTVRNCGDGPARWLHGYPCSESAQSG